jgi:hypothetical protein
MRTRDPTNFAIKLYYGVVLVVVCVSVDIFGGQEVARKRLNGISINGVGCRSIKVLRAVVVPMAIAPHFFLTSATSDFQGHESIGQEQNFGKERPSKWAELRKTRELLRLTRTN